MSSKDKILQLLEENKGRYISGEAIGNELGISRNAIWKAVNDLKASGYDIQAVRNRGYCLNLNNDILSVSGIISEMTIDFNRDLLFVFNTLESTNQTAKEMAISSFDHGTSIICSAQTQGRGHKGASFNSPEGGLYMSVILDPDKMTIKNPSHISAFAAVCACEALNAVTGIEPEIDLITDIFYKNRKIAGILTESAFDFETETLQWIVVGIGIPSRIETFADDKADTKDSPDYFRNQLAAKIIEELLAEHHSDEVLTYYKKHHK